jgi:hypothetical protein
MRRLRVPAAAIGAQLDSALGQRSPDDKKRADLRAWADAIVAGMRAEGRTMDSVDAIFAALYMEQKRIKVPNSYLAEVLKDLAKEIVTELRTCSVCRGHGEVGRAGVHTMETAPDCPACGGTGEVAA